MRKSFVFSLLFCLGSCILAQDASLTGFIVDLEDEEPLIGASVKVINQNIGGVTDISGKFKINNLSKGEYSLTISYVGYIDKELKVNIGVKANNKSSIIKSPDPSLTIHSPKPALSLLHIALDTSTKQPSNSSESAAAVLQ